MKKPSLKSVVEELQRRGGPCVLCDGWTHNVGLFVPVSDKAANEMLMGAAPEGNSRNACYFLCDSCDRADRGRTKVEAAMRDVFLTTDVKVIPTQTAQEGGGPTHYETPRMNPP